MRKIRLFFLMCGWMIQEVLSYRGMMLIWMFHIFFFPLVILLVWRSAALGNPTLSEKLPTLTNYYIILPLFALITSAWQAPYFAEKIRRGDLNKHLVKPISPFLHDVTNNLGSKLVKAIFLIPMVLVGMWLFPVTISVNLITGVYVAVALLLGLVVQFLLQAVIGVLGFWLDEVTSIINWSDALEYTLGGRLVPVFLFPMGMAVIARSLPFYYFTAFPLEILSGSISEQNIILGFGMQLVWIGIFFTGLMIGWKKGVAKYSAFGG